MGKLRGLRLIDRKKVKDHDRLPPGRDVFRRIRALPPELWVFSLSKNNDYTSCRAEEPGT